MERPACADCVRILHKHGVLLNQKAWRMPTVSENWAGQPLVDIETVVNLISNTTTRTGLKVRCDIDNNEYLKGTKITDGELVRSHLILFWSLVLELHHLVSSMSKTHKLFPNYSLCVNFGPRAISGRSTSPRRQRRTTEFFC